MNPENLIDLVLTTSDAFFEKEHLLLEVDANERSLTHKLAEQLQLVFPDWDVDCEYNRIVDDVKRLPRPEQVQTNDTQGRTIFPDIIVHRRTKPENLVAIEVKKTTNHIPGDEVKLAGLTSIGGDYRYRLGLFFIIDCGAICLADAFAFVDGEPNDDMNEYLAERIQRKGLGAPASA